MVIVHLVCFYYHNKWQPSQFNQHLFVCLLSKISVLVLSEMWLTSTQTLTCCAMVLKCMAWVWMWTFFVLCPLSLWIKKKKNPKVKKKKSVFVLPEINMMMAHRTSHRQESRCHNDSISSRSDIAHFYLIFLLDRWLGTFRKAW